MIPPEILYSLLGFLLGLVLCFVILQRKIRILESALAGERNIREESAQELQTVREKIAGLESENKRIAIVDEERRKLTEAVRLLEGDRGRLGAIANEVENLRQIRD